MQSGGANNSQTIYDIIKKNADAHPESAAILAPGRPTLTYRSLWALTNSIVDSLNNLGYGRDDQIGVALKNGPEMASALLTISAGATCVPLNPSLQLTEATRLFSLLKLNAIVLEKGSDSQIREAARALHIPVLELTSEPQGAAGNFALQGVARGKPIARTGLAKFDEIAIVLQTSGTTSQPKIVRIPHFKLTIGARNSSKGLGLSRNDRCISVIPLFHMAGISATTLTALTAGGSIVYPGDYEGLKFTDWVKSTSPTWYSAVPTIHMSVLELAKRDNLLARKFFRFIRSGAAPMPKSTITELEYTFGVPVIEAYAMTECFQIASNPMPPLERKVGSVGVPTGVDVRVVTDQGAIAASLQTGEIQISGPNVFSEYWNDVKSTSDAISDSWFKTGDLGYIDADGYLFITGRKKDLINRGGEKIVPTEVEEVLRSHPSIQEAVVFGIHDERLGEEVCAAVIVRSELPTTSAQIAEHLEQHLSAVKMPHRILLVSEIPKSKTGKVQRNQLEHFYSDLLRDPDEKDGASAKPSPQSIEMLRPLWEEVFKNPISNLNDNFFAIGGDSALAALLASKIGRALKRNISSRVIFESPTFLKLAKSMDALIVDANRLSKNENAVSQFVFTLPQRSSSEWISASLQQEIIFRAQTKAPAAFNITFALPISGKLNQKILNDCINQIVSRHESLRTIFKDNNGKLQQKVLPEVHVNIEHVDLSHLSAEALDRAIKDIGTKENGTVFSAQNGPLLKQVLLRIRTDEYILLLSFSHLICDRWSLGCFLHELIDLYGSAITSQASLLPELPLQVQDYTNWQRAVAQTFDANEVKIWQDRFNAIPAAAHVATSTLDGAEQKFLSLQTSISAQTVSRIEAFAAKGNRTKFSIMLASFALVWKQYSKQDKFLINALSSGREFPEMHHLIGCFNLPDPLIIDLAGVHDVETAINVVTSAHQELSRSLVPAFTKPMSARGRAAFNLQNVPLADSFQLPGTQTKLKWPDVLYHSLEVEEYGLNFNRSAILDATSVRTLSDLDLNFIHREIDGKIILTAWYRRGFKFESPTVKEFVDEYIGLLEKVGR